MKIALVHNDYGKFSGEEAVVREQASLFRENGCEVVEFRRSSAELQGLWGSIKGFASGIWNPFSVCRFGHWLEREKPDVVHVHNLYPLVHPAILSEAKKRGIRTLMTVHNFRLLCPSGLFAVDNAICEECAQRNSVMPCIRKNCLNSLPKSLGYALRHKMTIHYYQENVDTFLCLTSFQKQKLVQYGVPDDKCRILPNFIDNEWLQKARTVAPDRGEYVAYMGRLSEEKGIDLILEAARRLPHIPFCLAGNGADAYRDSAPANVTFMGYLTGDAQFEFLHHARLHLMASRCYENFPTTLLQGMALGIPAIVPSGGPMPDIIGNAGTTFASGGLTEVLESLYKDTERLQQYRNAALLRIHDFTPDKYWELYSEVLNG